MYCWYLYSPCTKTVYLRLSGTWISNYIHSYLCQQLLWVQQILQTIKEYKTAQVLTWITSSVHTISQLKYSEFCIFYILMFSFHSFFLGNCMADWRHHLPCDNVIFGSANLIHVIIRNLWRFLFIRPRHMNQLWTFAYNWGNTPDESDVKGIVLYSMY